MRPQKVDHDQLMTGLISVLRTKGFDGASMMDLSEATGLKKASLYHRFPGGKEEIGEAVLDHVKQWNEHNMRAVLTDSKLSPKKRLDKAINSLNILYDHGSSTCILKALATDEGLKLFGERIAESFESWMDGFKTLGLSMGFSSAKSETLAQEVIIKVQGSLILSKAINSTEPFQRSLSDIKRMYS